jgi:pimeloyl-ACP methyl ester carboxylesterase
MNRDNEKQYLFQAGKGGSFLLIHGLMVNGDMFEPVLDSLSKDYHVLVPDLRGFARSGHLAPSYTVEQHAYDLAKLLKSLKVTSSVVVGYSQGGVIAQQLAFDHPDLVSYLVLCSSFAYNLATWKEKIEGMMIPWLIRLLSNRQLTQMFKGLSVVQMKKVEEMIASNDKSRMIEASKEILRFDSRNRLKDIKCPTLIVAGEADDAVPVHHAHMLAHGIADAELIIVPKAGHEMIWTHGTALVNAVVSLLGE